MMYCYFFFNDTATTEIYTLSLHDALPISRPAVAAADLDKIVAGECLGFHPEGRRQRGLARHRGEPRRRRTAHLRRGRSEEHTSELQSRSDLVCRLLLEKK